MKLKVSQFFLKNLVVIMFAPHALALPISYPDQGLLPPVRSEVFKNLDLRIGTVKVCEVNQKARIPSFRVVMDFNQGFEDLKQSSAQLQDNYHAGEDQIREEAADGRLKNRLYGLQVAAITNFPKRSVGIPSFFLTLGVVSLNGEDTGTVVISPSIPVSDGIQVKLLNDNESSIHQGRRSITDYAETFHRLDIRVGTVTSLAEKRVDFGSELGSFTYRGDYPLFQEGLQVLRAINLEDLHDQDNFLGVVNEDRQLIPLTLERSLPNGRFLK